VIWWASSSARSRGVDFGGGGRLPPYFLGMPDGEGVDSGAGGGHPGPRCDVFFRVRDSVSEKAFRRVLLVSFIS